MTTLAAWGYGLAALAFLLLGLIGLRQWRAWRHFTLFTLATLLTAAWSGVSAWEAQAQAGPGLAGLLLEAARNAAWAGFLLQLLEARRPEGTRRPGFFVLLILAGLGLPVLLAGDLLVGSGSDALPRLVASVRNTLWLLTSLTGLILVEQVYRGARPEGRWALKFLCLGLGAMFAYDFYAHTHLVLFRAVDVDIWQARGFAVALLAPLLGLAASRQDTRSSNLVLSRRLVFHGTTLIGAGAYLLVMAAAGYYLRTRGGDWGHLLQTVFFFAALMLLAVVLFSGTLRARLRVFLNKHFFSLHYDYREEWLKFTRLLSEGQPGERLCERAVEALAGLVESPGGAVWLRESDGPYRRTAYWNMSDIQGESAADDPLVAWLKGQQWVVNLDEYRVNPQRYDALELPDWIHNHRDAWLVVPLLLHDDLLGYVVLKHSLGNITFNWEVSDLLKTASRQAAIHLAQMQANNALVVARQFESFNRTTTFVIHDLKNLVAQLSLLLSNAARHKHNPEFQEDMLATVESSVARMNKVLIQLRGATGQNGNQAVDLLRMLPEVIESKRAFKLRPELDARCSRAEVKADPSKLSRVIGHVLQNALEATPEHGRVTLKVGRDAGHVLLDIIDTGVGMDDAFIRDRLFRPFDSTKGAGMGIGAYECREYVRSLGGQVWVESTPGQGTRFAIQLPELEAQPAATLAGKEREVPARHARGAQELREEDAGQATGHPAGPPSGFATGM
jgi:putative PEP-CTERM system histidine kinase